MIVCLSEDEDFDPDAGFSKAGAAASDKWEGEDEEENVKVSFTLAPRIKLYVCSHVDFQKPIIYQTV